MCLKLTIIALVMIFTSVPTVSQNKSIDEERHALVATTLEEVLAEAGRLDDKVTMAAVKARSAALISYSNSAKSDEVFLQIWKLAGEQTDKGLREQVRLEVLKYLVLRNPKLADRLLSELRKSQNSSAELSHAGQDESSPLQAKLSLQMVDVDPSTAARLLEETLQSRPSPAGVGALLHLREKDSFLSDYIAAKALDSFSGQASLASLSGLELMAAYVFPGFEASTSSAEAESSLQQLQFKYFLVGYDVLKKSLGETNEALIKEKHFNQRDLQFRAANQAEVAAILAALAPRMQPSLAIELNEIARKLATQVPPNVAQFMQMALHRLSGDPISSQDPEQTFVLALSKGDFDAARGELNRLNDANKKAIYEQLVTKSEARSLLAGSNVIAALTAIRKLEDQTTRLVMYLEALKVAKKKRDADVTRIIIDEARLLIPQVDRNGLHARALLLFATQLASATPNDDAVDFLNSAVITINALGMRSNEQTQPKSMTDAAMSELNNPNSLLDAPEMEQAFSAMGLIDLERALAQAKRIEPRAVQLTARLEAIEGVIKRAPSRPKPPTPTAKPSANRERSSSSPRL